MTGGAGFSRDSMNSLKRNRALLNKRKKMADNPYAQAKRSKPITENYTELQQWKNVLFKRRRKITLNIVAVIVIVSLLVVVYYAI